MPLTQTSEEQVDIINTKNVVIGTATKSVAHKDGLLHRIVIGEIVNSKGEYCFFEQASDRQDAGQFVSPVGGHVQKGERIEDALCRECQEEAGFNPVDLKYAGVTIYERHVIGRHENHYFFVYTIRHNGPIILNHESISYKWFSVDAIKQTLKANPRSFGAAWHHVFQNIFPDIYNQKPI